MCYTRDSFGYGNDGRRWVAMGTVGYNLGYTGTKK